MPGVAWKVQTFSCEKLGIYACAGPATLVVYGEHGHSEPFQIGMEKDFKFGAPGSRVDDFQAQVSNSS